MPGRLHRTETTWRIRGGINPCQCLALMAECQGKTVNSYLGVVFGEGKEDKRFIFLIDHSLIRNQQADKTMETT
jgi:hypothetical protein